MRGESTPERKFGLNRVSNSQPPGHESDSFTTEPSGRGQGSLKKGVKHYGKGR